MSFGELKKKKKEIKNQYIKNYYQGGQLERGAYTDVAFVLKFSTDTEITLVDIANITFYKQSLISITQIFRIYKEERNERTY